MDNMAQERNEMFFIRLHITFDYDAVIRSSLRCLIIDSTGRSVLVAFIPYRNHIFNHTTEISFQFNEDNYIQNEQSNEPMEVFITRPSNFQLINSVHLRVTPLTVDDAISRGIISDFQEENEYSSNRASRLSPSHKIE